MNCKQGDLAVVVRSVAGNEGKIVRCLGFLMMEWHHTSCAVPSWHIDTELVGSDGTKSAVIEDSRLRPIRGSDGEDETLQWCRLPSKVTA